MTQPQTPAQTQTPYEQERTNTGVIVLFTVVLAVVTAGLAIAMWQLDRWVALEPVRQQDGPPVVAVQEEEPAGFRHWSNVAADLAEINAREARRLESYQWLDRPSGRVQIPIDRAMELIAARATEQEGTDGPKE